MEYNFLYFGSVMKLKPKDSIKPIWNVKNRSPSVSVIPVTLAKARGAAYATSPSGAK
jgi:hypothetical protein